MRLAIRLFALLCMPAMAAPPVPVKSRPPSERSIHPVREASAQVVSLNLAKLAAGLSAPIASIPAEPGRRIANGAAVAQLDCADAQIAGHRAGRQVADPGPRGGKSGVGAAGGHHAVHHADPVPAGDADRAGLARQAAPPDRRLNRELPG